MDELVHKPHNMSPENLETRPTNHSHAGPQEMVSSAVSSSSQGSIIENLKSLCDVFVWGESIGDGLLHCKKTQTAKFYLRKRGFMRN